MADGSDPKNQEALNRQIAKADRRDRRRRLWGLWRLWPERSYRLWDARPYDFDNYRELEERGESTR